MKLLRIIRNTLALIVPRGRHGALASLQPAPAGRSLLDKMGRAYVRCVEGEEHMNISFSYRNKQSSLNRPINEALEKSLTRIQSTLKKHLDKEMKKRKKMKLDDSASSVLMNVDELDISLVSNENDPIDVDVLNESAWRDGAVLSVGDIQYEVCRNFPTIQRLHLPSFVLVGCPVFPRITSEFTKGEECSYTWFRQVNKQLGDKDMNDATDNGENPNWLEVGQHKTYTPTSLDVGSKLKLLCTPKNGEKVGEEKECVTMRAVKCGPEMYPFQKRHEFTKDRTSPDCLRIFSYNILADMYADSDFSRDYLYPYCSTISLDIDYREQLILKELSGYNADILCLQECGKKLFQYSLEPALNDQGYKGLLICKTRQTPEGEALFYKEDRFRLIDQHDISLAEAFQEEPSNKDLVEAVSKSKAMLNQVITRSSVLQVTVLEDIHAPRRRICVANTHLYFHPRAGHIRLIQTITILRHLHKIQQQHLEKSPDIELAMIFCGDLNSSPTCPGVYELISKKHIPENHVQWYCGGKEEFCGGMTLTHFLDFTNACTSQEYTNFVAGFVASLDYVLIDSNHLEVVREIPMPDHDDVTAHVALPNDVFPSDHLAIGCDVRWKNS
nr:2',5'-phosphodiesterase 12-like [Lytechinus pictus]